MNEKLYKYGIVGIGTLVMMVSPFFINLPIGKIGMVVGLSLLTIQTYQTVWVN